MNIDKILKHKLLWMEIKELEDRFRRLHKQKEALTDEQIAVTENIFKKIDQAQAIADSMQEDEYNESKLNTQEP